MEMIRKVTALLSVMCMLMSAAIAPVFSGPPYYHEEGNVNYPGSYFESVYVEKGIGVDDYINIVDVAVHARAWGRTPFDPWGVGWGLYNPDADINDDGFIDIEDAQLIGLNMGLNYHYSPFEKKPGSPNVSVVAPGKTIAIGEQFNVSIEIDSKKEWINTYEFTLSWNPKLLNAVSVEVGDFMSGSFVGFCGVIGEGYLYFGVTLTTDYTVGGSGILATITFECLDKGKTTLDLSSRLFDIDLYTIRHRDIDGEVKQHP